MYPTINEESGLVLEPIPQNEGWAPRFFEDSISTEAIGFRVVSPSVDVPARITFAENYISGPSITGLSFSVVATGFDLAHNSHRFLHEDEDEYREIMGFFTDIAYSATVLRFAPFYEYIPQPRVSPPPAPRHFFTADTVVEIDGVSIQAIQFVTVAPGVVSAMISPRVFADIIGADIHWNSERRTVDLSRNTRNGIQGASLTVDRSFFIAQGASHDFAVHADQPELRRQITPVIIDGRVYVPVRALARTFDIPLDFENGTVVLG
jgi:hypothetical protein